MILDLAFIPEADVENNLIKLVDNMPAVILPLLDYFQNNYSGRPKRIGTDKRSLQFPVQLSNVYNRILNDENKTNNHAETA